MKGIRQPKIGIFGLGNMGRAIFGLLCNQKKVFSVKMFFAVDKSRRNFPKGICRINTFPQLLQTCDIVFLCIKPQDFHKLQPASTKSRCVVVSIMAGVKMKNIAKISGSKKIIRAMPNLPLVIGEGITGWIADERNLKQKELNLARRLFDALGYNFEVKREGMLDAVTAISGSGPAYVFLFLKALAESAKNLGIDSHTADKMAAQLTRGSVDFFLQAGKTADELIAAVKSKRGTTEAALKELKVEKFIDAWKKATKKAYTRSKELSSNATKYTWRNRHRRSTV